MSLLAAYGTVAYDTAVLLTYGTTTTTTVLFRAIAIKAWPVTVVSVQNHLGAETHINTHFSLKLLHEHESTLSYNF